MTFNATPLAGCYVVELNPVGDARGWFARTYCKSEFVSIGHSSEWVQMNHSFTGQKATVRGMHFQHPPFAEIKMLRCIAGAVYDVVVDIRKDSPTFLQWYGTELSASNKKMIYIPLGFAHGFQTLADDCELIYHHSQFYQPGVEGGIKFDDPLLKIEWPLAPGTISERDNQHPLLGENFKGI